MNKVICFSKLLITVFQFKLTHSGTDYWHWLFKYVLENKSKNRDKCLIMFLIVDAHQRHDYNAACNVYEAIRDKIDANWPSKKGLTLILTCSEKANRTDISDIIRNKLRIKEQGKNTRS